MSRVKRLKSAGDTIVEVLIAITVLSTVLGGAYASSRTSLNTTQTAKERDQGVRLVESQLERLKALSKSDAIDIFTIASPFCIDASLNRQDSCILDSANNNYDSATSQSIPYTVSVSRDDSSGEAIFISTATWERSGGGSQEEVSLVYRTYP